MKIYIVVTDVVNDVTYSRKRVLKYTCGHTIFYDMTLSTGKQRRHIIKNNTILYAIINRSHNVCCCGKMHFSSYIIDEMVRFLGI